MIQYIVHLYREMRLSYTGIEADTPQAAAAIASGKPTADADTIEDCDGQNLAALVDVAGDEDYSESVTVDFEAERIRKAAPALLEALKQCWQQLSLWVADIESCDMSPEDDEALAKACAAIAEAKTAGIPPEPVPAKQPSRFEIEHDPLGNPDRSYVLVDGKFDVAIIRTDEGIVIDVYPKDWIDPIDTMTVWDEQVAEAAAEAEADAAEEA